jgi:hypothetical protein
LRSLILIAGIAVALLASASLWYDEGEVVTLTTTNGSGTEFETRLWIVELEGVPYLRAESKTAAWVERIHVRPDVQLDRAGRRADYLAIPIGTADTRESVSLAMAEKYGRLDRAIAMFRDYDRSVPVRLQSRLPQQPLASGSRTAGLSP